MAPARRRRPLTPGTARRPAPHDHLEGSAQLVIETVNQPLTLNHDADGTDGEGEQHEDGDERRHQAAAKRPVAKGPRALTHRRA